MKYLKPALSFPEQADQLLARGLIADRETLINRLESVNYYRLSAYWYTFRVKGASDDRLIPGTTLNVVWDRYAFDRQLRVLVIDAIERVEVAIRTQVVNQHSLKYGPFGYLNQNTLPGISVKDHHTFLKIIHDEAEKSREDFVLHYFDKYKREEHNLPLWMACELLTFGGTLTLFRNVEKEIKQSIAAKFGVADKVLESWLLTLNFIRNVCAHHARLWNRGMDNKEPAIPRVNKHPQWHTPVAIKPDRIFGVLTVLYYLLKQVAPQSHWRDRLIDLFDKHPDVPLKFMGFPDNWQDCPIWKHDGKFGGSDV